MATRSYLTQLGRPSVDRAFNELRTITRIYDVNGTAIKGDKVNDEVFLNYGTSDEEFPSALLVKRAMQTISPDKSAYVGRLTEVYQEFTDNQKVSVGEDQIIRGDDGRTSLVRRYVALSAQAEALAATVGTVLDGRACQTAQINKQGFGSEIVETYISAGKLAETNSEKNDGKLLLKTLTYFNTVPPTPGGYILTDTQVQNPLGTPTYVYQFAKGVGEISRKTSYNQSDDEGVTGATSISIVHLTASSVTADPTISPGAGFAKADVNKSDQDGYRVWSVTYGKGTGLVAQRISSREDGLRSVTNISFGTRIAPDGIVLDDDWRMAEGYKVYTVTTMQAADGGSAPTAVSLSFERWVPFIYPGRAKAFTEVYDGCTMLNVFESPEVRTEVLATVAITYQTSNSLGVIANYWNPSEWATIRAQWTGAYGVASSMNKALPGYRSFSATPVTLAGTGFGKTVFGHNIYNGTTAKITVTGGPADPGGTTKTLFAELKPAFTSSDGTQYYRKTIISAAIPAQAALPV